MPRFYARAAIRKSHRGDVRATNTAAFSSKNRDGFEKIFLAILAILAANF